MMVLDGHLFPVVVVARVREPVEEVRRQRAGAFEPCPGFGSKERVAGERQFPNPLQRVGISLDAAVEGVLGEPGRPRLVEPLLERASLIRPAVVVVARRDDGENPGQVRR